MTWCDTGKNKERSDMNGEQQVEEISEEEKIMTEEKLVSEVQEATEPDDLCPIDQQPWSTSACMVLEERLLGKLLQRLQAEQPSEEVVAPAAEIEQDDPTAAANS